MIQIIVFQIDACLLTFIYAATKKQLPDYLPAMHAVRKHATLPQIMALTTIFERSVFRLGSSAPMPPKVIPIELKFENPHRA